MRRYAHSRRSRAGRLRRWEPTDDTCLPKKGDPLKGIGGDAIFAVLCACGHNIRKILANLRAILALIIAALVAAIWHRPTNQIEPQAA